MNRVIVFDPGGTTGYAVFEPEEFGRYHIAECGEFPLWSRLPNLIQSGDTVVYEEIKSLHPSFNPIGLEVTGVIKYLASIKTAKELIPRSPTMIVGPRNWWSAIVPLHLRDISRYDHALDAVLHGISYLKRTRINLEHQGLELRVR